MNCEMIGADLDPNKMLQNLTVVLVDRDVELCSQRLLNECLNLVGGHAAHFSGCGRLTLHQCGGNVVSVSATVSKRMHGRHQVASVVEDAAHKERVGCFTCRDVICALLIELRLDCVIHFAIENFGLFAGKDIALELDLADVSGCAASRPAHRG